MLGPLTLFDTSKGTIIVEKIAYQLLEMNENETQEFLKEIREQTIGFLESYKHDPRIIQQFLYTYGSDLYRTVNYLSVMFDKVLLYLDATARPIFEWYRENGWQLHLLISNDFPDYFRLLQVFPGFFKATGLSYVSPVYFASKLLENDGCKPEDFRTGYDLCKEEAVALCHDAVRKLIAERRSYIYVDANEEDLDHFTLSLSYKGKDGQVVALKTSGPEDGIGSVYLAEHERTD